MVSGIINSKYIKDVAIVKDVDFVVYELIKPDLKPQKQFTFLNKKGFNIVYNMYLDDTSTENLSQILLERRQNSPYEIDGIIVTSNNIYKRLVGENPKHSIAFKMVLQEQIAETMVLDVEWNPSTWGVLKPVVIIKPVYLEGVTIKRVTGINAKFITNNNIGGAIGPGAIIQIIRSGSVIPKIVKVITPALKPKLPVKYKWNSTGVDILVEDDTNNITIKSKQLLRFIISIGVENLKRSRIIQCMNAGIDTIPKLLNSTVEDFLEIEGIKEKMANKIYTNIQTSYQKCSLSELMKGSSCFGSGLGIKKISKVLETYPTILSWKIDKNSNIYHKINSVEGFSDKTTTKFIQGLIKMKQFMKTLPPKIQQSQSSPPSKINSNLDGLYVLFSGYRSKELEKYITDRGGEICSSFSGKVTHLIIKDKTKETGKTKKAKKKQIPIFTDQEFLNVY